MSNNIVELDPHPLESALRAIHGNHNYEYLKNVGRFMGYDYWETLEYGAFFYENEVQFPAANGNRIPFKR